MKMEPSTSVGKRCGILNGFNIHQIAAETSPNIAAFATLHELPIASVIDGITKPPESSVQQAQLAALRFGTTHK